MVLYVCTAAGAAGGCWRLLELLEELLLCDDDLQSAAHLYGPPPGAARAAARQPARPIQNKRLRQDRESSGGSREPARASRLGGAVHI